jgi:hypothetical protein
LEQSALGGDGRYKKTIPDKVAIERLLIEEGIKAIRRRFGRAVEIVVRGDSGFARDAIMGWCERQGVFYCFGLAGGCPDQDVFAQVWRNLQAWPA